MPTVSDQFLNQGFVYDEKLQGYVKLGQQSELDRPVWDEWMAPKTPEGGEFKGKTIYWFDAEFALPWIGRLPWVEERILKWVANVGGMLQGALQGWKYLGSLVYTHKTVSDLYKIRWGFAPPEDTVISGLGAVVIPIAAVLAATGVVFLSFGYVVRSFRMKSEDLAAGGLFGFKGLLSGTRGLLILGIVLVLLWKLMPTSGGKD